MDAVRCICVSVFLNICMSLIQGSLRGPATQGSVMLGTSRGTGMADTAAVANSIKEAAVAGVTGVTARQREAQTRLLVRDTATR